MVVRRAIGNFIASATYRACELNDVQRANVLHRQPVHKMVGLSIAAS